MMTKSNEAVVFANTIQFAPNSTVAYPDVYSRMFLWCESGEGEVRVNGTRYQLTKDHFLILPWKHSISYRADKIHPYKLGGVHIIPHYSQDIPFRPSVAHNSSLIWWERNQLSDRIIPGLDQVVSGKFTNEDGLKNLSTHIIELFHGERINRSSATAAAVLFLDEIQHWLGCKQEESKRGETARLERITNYIRENLSREITLEQLCETGAVSRSTLRRIFLTSTGVSPYEWIIQTRLDRARYLLRTSSESISLISRQCGFEDSSYFIRIFHKREGITPGQFQLDAYKI